MTALSHKLTSLIYVIGLSFAINTWAEPVCVNGLTTLRCGKGTVANIDYRGFLDVDGTLVTSEVKGYGSTNIQNAEINKLFIRGDSNLSNTTIAGAVDIAGTIHSTNVEIRNSAIISGSYYGEHTKFTSDANLRGSISCKHCAFEKSTRLSGEIFIAHSEFTDPLLINMTNSIFSSSKLSDLTISKPSHNEEQILQLKNGTVAQNIRFDNQNGTVILSEGSSVAGIVQGAKVITK